MVFQEKNQESYRQFVGEMVIAESKLINLKKIGHDLDRAISNGMDDILPNASHLWCTQHLQRADAAKLRDMGVNLRNAGRIMTDIYGAQINTLECRGLADADDEEDLDVK